MRVSLYPAGGNVIGTMICTVCSKPMVSCACPDKAERIEKIAESPYVLVMFCRTCGLSQYDCKCEAPKYHDRQGRFTDEQLASRVRSYGKEL